MSIRKSIPKEVQAKVFVRDKWCCRYCGIEVYFSPALKTLEDLSPNHGYYHRNGHKDRMSPHLLGRCAAVDHINPVTLRGTNNIENLICACWECNSKKSNNDPLDWVARIIPIEKLKVANEWDGFLSLIKKLDDKNSWLKYFPK